MTDVHLELVTEANWHDCASLTVRPDQADYVAAVTYYLSLCAYGSTWQPLAIVRDGAVVGFCMWAVDDDGSRWIGGLVIDAAAQRTGVARKQSSRSSSASRWSRGAPVLHSATAPTTLRPGGCTPHSGSSRRARPWMGAQKSWQDDR